MTGAELRAQRQAKGWSQGQLAREAGIDTRNINDYEGGRKGITRLGARLFTILLSPQWLLTDVNPSPARGGRASGAGSATPAAS